LLRERELLHYGDGMREHLWRLEGAEPKAQVERVSHVRCTEAAQSPIEIVTELKDESRELATKFCTLPLLECEAVPLLHTDEH
jgi:hypothetical protein